MNCSSDVFKIKQEGECIGAEPKLFLGILRRG